MREAYYMYYSKAMSQPSRQRVPGQGDWGIAVPFFAGLMIVAIVGFWPAMVWHGYGGPTGNDWRWDIHSTIAEAVYLGLVGFIAALVVAGNRPARTAVKPKRERSWPPPKYVPPPPPPPPVCYHLGAVPVDLSTGERVAWWCEACETQLGEAFGRLARPCCGSAPGTVHQYNCHQYNCPHLKGSPS